mmetsp:Transcript_12936/g.24026  ORF Transcript_12936/g.24026 Transcript_12936/m.24026 type:complete len:119 (-) Transcript_12936:30-386(-)
MGCCESKTHELAAAIEFSIQDGTMHSQSSASPEITSLAESSRHHSPRKVIRTFAQQSPVQFSRRPKARLLDEVTNIGSLMAIPGFPAEKPAVSGSTRSRLRTTSAHSNETSISLSRLM